VLDLPPSYDLTPLSAVREAVLSQQAQAAAAADASASEHSRLVCNEGIWPPVLDAVAGVY